MKRPEPVFEIEVSGSHWIYCSPGPLAPVPGADFSTWPDGVNKLYTAPPKPAVSDSIINSFHKVAMQYGCTPHQAQFIVVGWNACIAAILNQ